MCVHPCAFANRRERRKERDKLKKERARRAREEGLPLDGDKPAVEVDEDAMLVDPVPAQEEVDEAAVMAALGFATFNTTKVRFCLFPPSPPPPYPVPVALVVLCAV